MYMYHFLHSFSIKISYKNIKEKKIQWWQSYAGNTYRKLGTNIKRYKELQTCLNLLSIPEMQGVPLQEL